MKWINVKDRVPNCCERILMYCDRSNFIEGPNRHIKVFSGFYCQRDGGFVADLLYEREKPEFYMHTLGRVTYWMSLPEYAEITEE